MLIQIIGLPGSGKTTLAKELSNRINAIHLNADEIRADLNSDLGFTPKDRIEQARRMGALSRLLVGQGYTIVVDFICPTAETREAFGKADVIVWMKRVIAGRFEDTNKLWENPVYFDQDFDETWSLEDKVNYIIKNFNLHDWKAPTTLMLGRYQPWHEGHHALYQEAGKRTDQVMLGVRDTQGTSTKDPLGFEQVKQYIEKDSFMSGAMVVKMPNITNIIYGRDVGYKIEQVGLDPEIEAISATQKRKELGI
ncbi:Adenylylsulphate kinase [uncultured Caudovirales phage]|uniref:Adenylylsulphate kinase n=1 Tax=uncultured Caudovirales phage TaxID=2100421 RepID=A0A6J5R4K7_9CAUD|nr:Adenylylsulphate kinase [uncultured Caudovirales phage]CAB4151105.1 Adenylylsulphate kinase [uncultured Caudovirales phage]CAB4173865.1 Adenylylsulphate kinase [uncultured Caudovirales phage]CAB4179750.1 Adenylylsulphate kinase [uncultured Caudovirales phage]CAB4185881.1 Adenylylsulphate kinase [uncultured Caudovirales phage]